MILQSQTESGMGRIVIAMALFVFAPSATSAADVKPATFTYKKVGPLEIKADVYRPEGMGGMRPVLVWIHGGALMSGSRQSVSDHPLKDAMLRDGLVVVSIDYRLGPETKRSFDWDRTGPAKKDGPEV